MYKLGGCFLEKLRKVKHFLLWPGGGEQPASPRGRSPAETCRWGEGVGGLCEHPLGSRGEQSAGPAQDLLRSLVKQRFTEAISHAMAMGALVTAVRRCYGHF